MGTCLFLNISIDSYCRATTTGLHDQMLTVLRNYCYDTVVQLDLTVAAFRGALAQFPDQLEATFRQITPATGSQAESLGDAATAFQHALHNVVSNLTKQLSSTRKYSRSMCHSQRF